MDLLFILICAAGLYVLGASIWNEAAGGFVAFIFIMFSTYRYNKEKQKELEAQELSKEQKYEKNFKAIQTGELEEIQVNNLLLRKGEKCFYSEKLFVGMLYVTNQRVILVSELKDKFDRQIEEVTYIKAFNDSLLLQFGEVAHEIPTGNAQIIREVIMKLSQLKSEETEEIICEYCGVSNNKADKVCSNCNAPLNKN